MTMMIMIADMITGMGTIMTTDGALYDLLSWMSPAWPIGAFAHSSGLEWAVEAGWVSDARSAEAWIGDMLARGAIATDAILFVHAHRAAAASDGERLAEVAELAVATLTSAERRVEATAQGAAFRRIARATAAAPTLALLDPVEDAALSYAMVAAATMAGHGIALNAALTAFLHGVVANLVSAAQRLVPLGQTDGQRILRALRQPVAAAVAHAATLDDGDPFDAIGSATLVADLACMAHETQYTRLFRT
ncbi:MAG: urease accessory protein [Alphaproteobacteria bacterium]|nr:urease accessory protein [Alphaproteobacteria bacterium]